MSAPYLTATSQTKAFESYVGNTLHFIDELENDKQSCHKDLSADNLKMLYEEKVKQALELRCLLSPYSLDGIDAASLHFSYKDIIGDFPKYMTSFDLMINLKMTAEVHWGPYLDYLSQERMLIVEDWTNRLYTGSVATLCNDGLLGVPFDEDKGLFFRGEAGAYVKGEKTNLSFIISLGKQIHRSQIYYGVPCMKDDCIQAEVLAMYLLLKRGIELGLHLHKMQVCTHSELVYEILIGVHETKDDTKAKHVKHRDLFMLLTRMRTLYKDLICLWIPRAKSMFFDILLRESIMEENAEQRSALIWKAWRDWAPYLQGSPIPIISDYNNNMITSLDKRKIVINDTHQCCYLEVDENHKVDALWHIGVALCPPSKLFVALKNLDIKPIIRREMMRLFLYDMVDCTTGVDYSLLAFYDSRLATDETSGPDLLIIFDATISKEPFLLKNTLIVYLSTPEEKILMEEHMIHKFSHLSFFSDHGPEKQRNEEKAKLKEPEAAEDFVLKEVTKPTTGVELIKARQNDKEQLCNISRALAVLASAPSVSKEHQEFLSLVNNEIEFCNSMLEREGREGEEAKRAYIATREEIDAAAEVATEEKVSSPLIGKVNAMLQELEKEIDGVDAESVNRCQWLDRDHPGEGTPDEVAAAVAYLKDTILKGGLQEFICNLSKYEGKFEVEDTVKLASQSEENNGEDFEETS